MDISLLNDSVDLAPGEWVDDIPELEGVSFKVRSTQYKPFGVAVSGLARRSGKKMHSDKGLSDFHIATGKPLAEHILLDWKGVKSNGKPLPFSKEQALTILTADDPHGIGATYRKGVEWAGDRLADRIRERSEEAAGN